MIDKLDRIEQRISLRAEAESMVARFYPKEAVSETAEKLLHELMIHKVELELQNEELRVAHASMAEMLDHYRYLFDYAPVGYLTISRQGLIIGANLTGCALLGIELKKLINQPISRFIAPQNVDRWHLLFRGMLESSDNEKTEFNLEMITNMQARFSADLVCSKRKSDEMTGLRIVFTNICKSTGKSCINID